MTDTQSASIGKLADALSTRDAEAESIAILPLTRKRLNRRRPTLREAFFERIAYGMGDCWYWVGARGNIGYGILAPARAYGCPEIMAHRISWHIHRGTVPEGVKVLHRCDVRACVNPDHLFLGTQADNVADMVAKGRNRSGDVTGERNPMARLTGATVRAMRDDFATGGFTQRGLARKFGVSPMTVSRAVRGLSWRKA